MTQITVTEALAELKTLGKRLETKEQFVAQYLVLPASSRDPLEKDGGSVAAIASAMQAAGDLRERIVAIRRAIAGANASNSITIGKLTRTLADWLVWRRDVAPKLQLFLLSLRTRIDNQRGQGLRQLVYNASDAKPADLLVHLSELALAEQIEALENTLGSLDGQLTLKNATILVEV